MAQGDRPGKQPFDPAKAEQMKSDFIRGAKYAPFDLVGAPVDLTTMAMRGLGVPVPEKPFLSSEYLIDKYADLGEALDINYDRPTGSGMETLGRIAAGLAGVGGEAAALAPGIGRVFAQTTKARGSGAEVKGSGAAQLETPTSDLEARTPDLPTVPKKEVLEGEVVGSKSKKYMDLQKQMDEARSPDLRAARELNMETQGVKDAFDLNAASNIDKNFEFASGGDEVRSTADEFIDGVIDEFQGARDQGFNRGEALIDAVRVKVNDYNDIYPDALDVNSVLDDIAKNVNEDFGFDDALSRFRKAQTNQKSLQDQAQTAKYQRIAEEQAAARRVQEEQLGIADLSDADKAAFYRQMGEAEQSGIAGAGIPDPQPPKPNLRLVKKAAGGPVDLRSGIGNVFKLYS